MYGRNHFTEFHDNLIGAMSVAVPLVAKMTCYAARGPTVAKGIFVLRGKDSDMSWCWQWCMAFNELLTYYSIAVIRLQIVGHLYPTLV